jgi:hypothetical protein
VTVAFTVGAAVVLGLCLAVLYLTLNRQFAVAFDADLAARADDLASAVRAGDGAVVSRDPLAQLYGPDGAVIEGSPALSGSRLLSPSEVGRADGRTLRTEPVADIAGVPRVRVLSERLADGHMLAVGVATGPLDEVRRLLLQVVLLAAPVLLALLALAGWLLVRAALRPVDELTREAAAISLVRAGAGAAGRQGRRRDRPAGRHPGRHAGPPPGGVRAGAGLRRRRQPRAAHAGRGGARRARAGARLGR